VGERCALLLDEAKQPVEHVFNVPGGIAGVTPLVQDLLFQIERWQTVEKIDQVLLIHNRPIGSSLYDQNLVQLLPLDLNWLRHLEAEPWASRSLPIFSMDWEQLFSSLIQQYLFVAIYRASAESLASEDASRLAAMQNAERNIEDRMDELNAEYHHQRQNSITAELLDIVAGFEAVEMG
jgi:F-type H+-transporting ATPase subunit gamma